MCLCRLPSYDTGPLDDVNYTRRSLGWVFGVDLWKQKSNLRVVCPVCPWIMNDHGSFKEIGKEGRGVVSFLFTHVALASIDCILCGFLRQHLQETYQALYS